MNWIEASIYTNTQGIDVLVDLLTNLGINGFVIEDKKDLEIFLEEEKENFDLIEEELLNKDFKTNVKIYIPQNEQGANTLKLIKENIFTLKESSGMEYGSLEIDLTNVDEEDWANNWKEFFKPFSLGKNLLVKPTWENIKNEENRIVIDIDPGSSFGTGMHETTRLCLESLENYTKENDNIIDVGCGSGILSIAASKLGAGEVIAIDIDQNSVETTLSLSKINGCEDKIKGIIGDLATQIKGFKADIIVANIFAHTLKRLTPDTVRLIKKGGLYITSGIITDTLDIVINSYIENEYEIIEKRNIGQWWVVIGKKL